MSSCVCAEIEVNDDAAFSLDPDYGANATLHVDAQSSHVLSIDGNDSCSLSVDDDAALTWTREEYIPYRAGDLPTYDGETTITPLAHAQTVLATENTVVTSDITVLEVPYFETSNVSGMTVYIAQEV